MATISSRDKKIISLIKAGNTYSSIGLKFGLSKQRVGEISLDNKVKNTRIADTKRRNKELFKKMKADIKAGIPTEKIVKRHKVTRSTFYHIMKSVAGKSIIRGLRTK